MVYQAIYSSAATAAIDDAALADILAVARTRNAAAGITGALIFTEGLFLQILEGPKDGVSALLETIAADPRHCDMTVFHEADCDVPAFADWRMAYIDPDPATMAGWTGQGTATLADLRSEIERHPDRVPGILLTIVEALPGD